MVGVMGYRSKYLVTLVPAVLKLSGRERKNNNFVFPGVGVTRSGHIERKGKIIAR